MAGAEWTGVDHRSESLELNTLSNKLQSLHSDVGEIKGALNELTKAINKLAVIEERQAVTTASIERAFTAIAKVEERILELEKLAPESKRTSNWVERLGLTIIGAALMLVWDKIRG